MVVGVKVGAAVSVGVAVSVDVAVAVDVDVGVKVGVWPIKTESVVTSLPKFPSVTAARQ